MGFWVVAQAGAERLGEADEGDVVVPAGVAAAFEVVEPEAVFEFAVVVFDAPADLGQADQVAQGGVGGQVRQPVVGGFGLAGVAIRPAASIRAGSRRGCGGCRGWPVARAARGTASASRRSGCVGVLRVPCRQVTTLPAASGGDDQGPSGCPAPRGSGHRRAAATVTRRDLRRGGARIGAGRGLRPRPRRTCHETPVRAGTRWHRRSRHRRPRGDAAIPNRRPPDRR